MIEEWIQIAFNGTVRGVGGGVGGFGDILLSLQLSGERAVASEIVHERIFTTGSTKLDQNWCNDLIENWITEVYNSTQM